MDNFRTKITKESEFGIKMIFLSFANFYIYKTVNMITQWVFIQLTSQQHTLSYNKCYFWLFGFLWRFFVFGRFSEGASLIWRPISQQKIQDSKILFFIFWFFGFLWRFFVFRRFSGGASLIWRPISQQIIQNSKILFFNL